MLPPETAANKPGCLYVLGQIFSPKRWQEQRERNECLQMDTAVKLFLHNLMPFRAKIEQLETGRVMDLKNIGENTPFSTRVYATRHTSGYTVTLDERIITGFFLEQVTPYSPGFSFNPGIPVTSFEHTMVDIDVVGDDIRVQQGKKSSLSDGQDNPGWIKERLIEVTKPVTDRKAKTHILKYVADLLTPTSGEPTNP